MSIFLYAPYGAQVERRTSRRKLTVTSKQARHFLTHAIAAIQTLYAVPPSSLAPWVT